MDKGAKVNKAVKCETCGITLNSEQQARQHYSGKNHLKKLRGIGKKKEGKDGEDSDKESEHRKFRDRKARKREKVINDEASKASEKGDASLDVKADKGDQSETGKPEVGPDDVVDDDNDKTKLTNAMSDDVCNSISDSSDRAEPANSGGSEVTSGGDAVDADDDPGGLEGSARGCGSSSPNQSQNQVRESVKCAGLESGRDDGLLSDGGRSVCDGGSDATPTKEGGPPRRSPPNGLVVAAARQVASSPPSSERSDSEVGVKRCFPLPNGAVSPVIGECVGEIGASTTTTTAATTTTTKRPHSPTRSSSVHSSSGGRSAAPQPPPGGAPHKKQRSSYISGSVRASVISAPHLALAANSIPGYGALQAPARHLAADPVSPGGSQVALLRPVLPAHGGATSLASPLPSYGAQYGSVRSYPAAMTAGLTAGLAAGGSYSLQYQALTPSDVSGLHALRQGVLSPYYSAALNTSQLLAQAANKTLAVTPDLMTPQNSDVLTSDLTSFLAPSKELIGQPMAMSYASAAAGGAVLPPGYQYQALSMQALGSVPSAGGALYRASSSGSPYATSSTSTTTPSPPYLSLSGPKNVSAIPTIPISPAANPAPTVAPPGESPMAFGPARGAAVGDASKLDPVSQAVYDNVLGKLPLKRKKEIPCITCGLVFNSDAQASAHFSGSKHLKRQKANEEGEQVDDAKTMRSESDGDEQKETVRIPCQVCGLTFSNEEQADVHFRGVKHNKKLKLEQTKKEGLPSGVAVKDWGTPFSCTLCKTTLNSAEQLEQHLNGKQHRLRQAQQDGFTGTSLPPTIASNTWTEVAGREPGWFYCQTCDISVRTGMCLQRHVQSQKHKDKMLCKQQQQQQPQ